MALLAFWPVNSWPAEGPPSPGVRVTLQWDPSVGAEVNAYRLYLGTSSGSYVSFYLGEVTMATLSGLTPGDTYYFAVTAVTPSGLESEFSNEVNYTVPTPVPQLTLQPSQGGSFVLAGHGKPGVTYDILSSTDLAQWTPLLTVTAGTDGVYRHIYVPDSVDTRRFFKVRANAASGSAATSPSASPTQQ